MRKKRKGTSDALEILHRRYYAGRPRRIAQLKKAMTKDTRMREDLKVIVELRAARRDDCAGKFQAWKPRRPAC